MKKEKQETKKKEEEQEINKLKEMQTLLRKLNKSNIKIDLVDEKLDIQAPKGVMTEDLLNEIKLHKNELIEFITLYKTKKERYVFIPQAAEQLSYVLSSSQRRLWLLSQFDGGNASYNMPSVFELKGNVSITFLEKSFSRLIERHESLRTLFKEDETGEVRQFILNLEDIKFQLQYEDVSNEENVLEITREIIKKETAHSFDFTKDSLLNAKLLKTSQNTYVFICVMHHIISDGQSAEVMTNELFAFYDGYVRGDQNSLQVLKLQYKDYAAWQQNQLINNNIEGHKLYWLQQFEGELPILDLPTYQTRPVIKTYNGKSVNKVYRENLLKDFNDLCQSNGSTLFMGLLATVKMLLYKYTNQNDIVIGTPIAGREHADLQNQIGLYVNTLALRTQFDGKDSFKEILANVKQITLGAYEHQIYPFDELVEQLPLKRDRSRNPLFDVMVTVQNTDNLKVNAQRLGAIDIKEYETDASTVSKFDLGFTFTETDNGLGLTLTYNTDIYSEEFAQRISNHLETLLHSIVTKPDDSISSLNYLTEVEKHQLLIEFNTIKVDYPKDKTIIDLFEEQVAKTPENTAILFEDVKLTYAELNNKANQLAYYLKEQGVQAGSNIVLCFDSHLETAIVGIIGILKLGAVYVPIDPDYPQDRISYIIENSEAKFIVTNSIDVPLFDDETVTTILLDKEVFDYNTGTIKNIEKNCKNHDTAYAIYTSGTTGVPKGVLINHQNLMDYLFGLSLKIKIEENQSFALMSTLSTDLGNTVLFSSLIFGGVIHLFSKNTLRDIYYIQHYFANNQIDCIKIVPSYWKSLEIKGKLLSPSRMIIFGGEELSNEIVSQINLENPKLRIINHYGPTETTIGKLLHEVNPNYNYNRIPIGKAFSNTQLYVVDQNLSLCAIGIIGELLVGGDGVSDGYLNNLELTEEKFIDDIFNKTGKKLYRTGDQVLMHSDGNIEFKGRIDNQVKILGHRIELKEIENALNKFEGIKSSVVNVIETDKGNKRIAAYIVYNEEELVHDEILDHLRLFLPSIMIPSILIKIDEIPFTSNGKINHKALPSISEEDVSGREYAEPRDETEKILVTIWQEVLGIENIGITDNFFELGGHSLIVAQIINRIHQNLAMQISFKDFFASPTIEKIAKKLVRKDYVGMPKAPEQDNYPLTPSQRRLWFSCVTGGNKAYIIKQVFKIEGNFDVSIFQQSLKIIVNKHSILRSKFKIDNKNNPQQLLIDKEEFLNLFFGYEVISDIKTLDNVLFNYLESDLKIDEGPLFKINIIKHKEDEYYFFFAIHHLISDGWSNEVLMKEMSDNYNALKNGQIKEQNLDFQFYDYSYWLNNQYEKIELKERDFWKNVFEKPINYLELPFERGNRPMVNSFVAGDSLRGKFSKNLSDKINSHCESLNITTFSLVMKCFKILLYKYTNVTDLTIGTPISGRFRNDLENQIGLYLNTIPVRTNVDTNGSFEKNLIDEQAYLNDSYENQLFQMDRMITEFDLPTNPRRSPLFDIMIVNQNQGSLKQFDVLTHDEFNVSTWDKMKYNYIQFDLVFSYFKDSDHLFQYELLFNYEIFEHNHICKLFDDFLYLLEIILDKKDKVVDEFFQTTEHSFLTDSPIIYSLPENDFVQELAEDVDDIEFDESKRGIIKDIFEKQLNAQINNNQNYFLAGGNSIKSIEIVNEINNIFESQITIIDFYKNPDINSVYKLVFEISNTDSEEKPENTVLQIFNREIDNNKPSIILFPPIIGNSIIFTSLSELLKDDFNCYGINIPIFEEGLSESDYEELLLETILKEINPIIENTNEIHILGYSIGANVAFEICKKILENRSMNAYLYLVDRPPVSEKIFYSRRLLTRIVESHKAMIDFIMQFGISESDIYKRIEQILKYQQNYNIEGVVNATTIVFESSDNLENNYMQEWKHYVKNFIGVESLNGNHFEALNLTNIEIIKKAILKNHELH